jgi:DNA-binding HxlR family transcriptional regulator
LYFTSKRHSIFEVMIDKSRSKCLISFALDFLGDKWSLLVLRDIVFMDKQYYHQFAGSEEGISTNILADRLSKLEQYGFILKRQDESNKKRFIYSPTEKALDLIPVMIEFVRWSAKYNPNTGVLPQALSHIESDPQAFIDTLRLKFNNPV